MKLPTFTACLAILFATLVWSTAPSNNQPPESSDPMLESALRSTQHFLFTEQLISRTNPNFDVIVISAKDAQSKPESVYIRTGTTRIFRADAGFDEFTKQGGWYWKNGEARGQAQFNQPGALIMVVREADGTLRWYALGVDYRC